MGRNPYSLAHFLAKARSVHGDKYDYSQAEYKNMSTKIKIICPIHGAFWQLPHAHTSGEGCKNCSKSNMGNAFLDVSYLTNIVAYKHWRSIIHRVHCASYTSEHPTYQDCSIHSSWLLFSNFLSWFENAENGYQKGLQLDKDILVKGNKEYAPDKCCFVPQEINKLFTKRDNCRGNLPIGVSQNKRRGKPFRSTITMHGRPNVIGYYNTPEEAFYAYKDVKERYMKSIAEKYFQEGKITKKVYDALMKYEVEITD